MVTTPKGYRFISLPAELAPIIVGVFSLDTRNITKRNWADPPSTIPVTITTITTLYDFPTILAAGQTIGIFPGPAAPFSGYLASDIAASGRPPPIDISVDASNPSFPAGETTQDFFIAASVAPGAQIAVYFTTLDQKGWVDLITRVVHPNPGEPQCSVLSSSWYVSDRNDAATLAAESSPVSFVSAVSQAFDDAAIQNVTICIASGDTGAQSKRFDGKAHVQYPGSDPWVLACGGTTIGHMVGASCDEGAWDDVTGASGGGVSDFFPPPSYQIDTNVPASINDGHRGRGVPDVAANASVNSGYPFILNGGSALANGTSASAPLWAGLVAKEQRRNRAPYGALVRGVRVRHG
jgi:kumamolisin